MEFNKLQNEIMIENNSDENQKKIIKSPERLFDRQFVEACILGIGIFLLVIVFALAIVNWLLITDLEFYFGGSSMTGLVIIGNQIFICVVAGFTYKKIIGFFPKRSRRRELFWQKAYQCIESKRAKNKSRIFRQLLAEKRTERANQMLNKNFPNQESVDNQLIHSKAFRRKQISGYLLNYDSLEEQTKSQEN